MPKTRRPPEPPDYYEVQINPNTLAIALQQATEPLREEMQTIKAEVEELRQQQGLLVSALEQMRQQHSLSQMQLANDLSSLVERMERALNE